MLSPLGCCSCLLMLSLAAAAPVDKTAAVPGSVSKVLNQEQELQSLLKFADEKSARNDVTVHEEHVQHVHEINGHKTETETARKTVSDTKTGEVLSDVKEEVNKPGDSAGVGQPEVEVKVKVDVPSEGIHETIVESGPEQPPQAGEEEIEFSPEAVANYLYRTGDFNRFYSALAQLVNASMMTEEEAQSYSEIVALEYDRLQMEDYENNILVQRRAPQLLDNYPVAVETPDNYPLASESQDGYPVAMDTPETLLAMEEVPSPKDLEVEMDPYELLSALWSEAYGTGDVRAQALVGELFDKVRDDNDPDDEGQVRDILLDLIANSVMTEEPQPQQPQYSWQDLIDDDLPLMQPIRQPVMSQPIRQPVMSRPIQEMEDEAAANELMTGEKRAAEQPTGSEDTKAVDERPKAKNDSQEAAAEPVAVNKTKVDGKQTADSKSRTKQSAPDHLPTEKRAAETV